MGGKASATFQTGFAHGIVKHISLHDLGKSHHPEPEFSRKGVREFACMELPILSDADGGEDVGRFVIQMGEQIARWTRARELGVEYGTRM